MVVVGRRNNDSSCWKWILVGARVPAGEANRLDLDCGVVRGVWCGVGVLAGWCRISDDSFGSVLNVQLGEEGREGSPSAEILALQLMHNDCTTFD